MDKMTRRNLFAILFTASVTKEAQAAADAVGPLKIVKVEAIRFRELWLWL